MQLSIQLVVQPACVSLQGSYHAALRRQGLLSFRPVMCGSLLLWQDCWWLLALSLGAMVAESGCLAVGAVVGISQGAGMQLHACGVLTQRVHPANPSTIQTLFVWSLYGVSVLLTGCDGL